jgi:hypothetical protein
VSERSDPGCPICRGSATAIWIEEQREFLLKCDNCTTFTITEERQSAFREAWRLGDRETLMKLELLSHYLRLGGEDCDREVTADTWLSLALEGEHIDADSQS